MTVTKEISGILFIVSFRNLSKFTNRVYRIEEMQLPGRKRMPVAEVLKSRAALFAPGVVLG